VNWEPLAAIAETLGAIGVIATLVYLSSQVRQNSRELVESRTQRVFELMIESRSGLAEGRIAPIQVKVDCEEALTPEEEIRYRAHRAYNLNMWDSYLMGARAGSISSDLDDVMASRLAQGLAGNSPAALKNRGLWVQTKHLYTRAFQDYVDDLLKGRRDTGSTA
jgi:hypothetical protein